VTIQFINPTGQGQRARVALYGKSNTGKTLTALAVAAGLVPDGKVAVVDTEGGRIQQYRDGFTFQYYRMTNFAVAEYIRAIQAAEQAAYDVIILDSLTDAWVGRGGAWDQKRKKLSESRNKDGRAAWADASATQHQFYEVLRNSPLHIIATMRVLEESDRLRWIQRQDMDYQFDTMGYLDERHTLHITQANCEMLQGRSFHHPGTAKGCQFVATLRDWLCLDDGLYARKTAFAQRIVERFGARANITNGAGVKWLMDQAGVAYDPDNETRIEQAIARAVQDMEAQRQRNGDAPPSAEELAAIDDLAAQQSLGLGDVTEAREVKYP
jgi:hypothetical protein